MRSATVRSTAAASRRTNRPGACLGLGPASASRAPAGLRRSGGRAGPQVRRAGASLPTGSPDTHSERPLIASCAARAETGPGGWSTRAAARTRGPCVPPPVMVAAEFARASGPGRGGGAPGRQGVSIPRSESAGRHATQSDTKSQEISDCTVIDCCSSGSLTATNSPVQSGIYPLSRDPRLRRRKCGRSTVKHVVCAPGNTAASPPETRPIAPGNTAPRVARSCRVRSPAAGRAGPVGRRLESAARPTRTLDPV